MVFVAVRCSWSPSSVATYSAPSWSRSKASGLQSCLSSCCFFALNNARVPRLIIYQPLQPNTLRAMRSSNRSPAASLSRSLVPKIGASSAAAAAAASRATRNELGDSTGRAAIAGWRARVQLCACSVGGLTCAPISTRAKVPRAGH